MEKLIRNTWKTIKKNKEFPYLKYWDVNNLYAWALQQNLPVHNFEWIEDTSLLNEWIL